MFLETTVPTEYNRWRDQVHSEEQTLKFAALSFSSADARRSYADLVRGNFSNDDLIFLLLEDQLVELGSLRQGWDFYYAPAPSHRTIEDAGIAIQQLRTERLTPEAICPSAEGGVSVYFSRGKQKAFIEFLNEGEVVLARYGKDDEPNVTVLRNGLQDLNDQALQEIRDHLGTRA